MATYKGKNYCLHQGGSPGDSGTLWCATFDYSPEDGTFKFSDRQIAREAISGSPTVAVFGSLLYCFYQGRTGGQPDGSLRCQIYDGKEWTSSAVITTNVMTDSPSAAVYSKGNELMCAFSKNGKLFYTTSPDGKMWSLPPDETLNVTLSYGPNLIEYDAKIYCLHQQEKMPSGYLEWNVFNGSGWQADKLVNGIGLTGSPAGSVLPATGTQSAKICCVHRGLDGNDLWHSYFDGKTWETDLRQPVGDAVGDPAVLRIA
ncbi:hypothetical protein AB0O69_06605 [Streptomyces xiamenensis]|uniref:hypothetical protein n=1 Tax=Streptomyces xiamenensis TaxID=408015 RepID=UPI00343926F7